MRFCLVVALWVGMARFTTATPALALFRRPLAQASIAPLSCSPLHIAITASSDSRESSTSLHRYLLAMAGCVRGKAPPLFKRILVRIDGWNGSKRGLGNGYCDREEVRG